MPELLPDGWLEKRAADAKAEAIALAEYNLVRWAVRLGGLVVTAVPISVIGYAWHASGYEWKVPAAISFVVLTIGVWAIRRAARIW